MDYLQKYIDENGDPRVKDYYFLNQPSAILLVTILYVLGVTVIGPKLMQNRKPFELKNTLIIYNALQVVLSYVVFHRMWNIWMYQYNWRCEPFVTDADETQYYIINTGYIYYLSKYTEFLDTIFFVLRKKFNQISTLHVIHHAIMPSVVWSGLIFVPGGHGCFFIFLNSFIHVVMYTYYLLAALGPQVQKHLWWKKYLTKLQLIQFAMIFFHGLQLFFNNSCNYPMYPAYMALFIGAMFFYLFSCKFKT
jgi:elongation of very long chain fatty acids protein 7